jgi:hypothetical protein
MIFLNATSHAEQVILFQGFNSDNPDAAVDRDYAGSIERVMRRNAERAVPNFAWHERCTGHTVKTGAAQVTGYGLDKRAGLTIE